MRVLFLQQQPCMRTLKYAVGLRAARIDLSLGFAFQGQTLSGWYGTGDELFDRWWPLAAEPAGDLERVVEEFRPHLIHSHNLPDSLTVVAQEICDDRVPVVHDVHDLQSLRRTPYEAGFPEPADPLALEKRAIEGSAAVVAVSPEMLEEMEARHAVPDRRLVFANYALGRDLPAVLPPPERRREGRFRIVYQGTLSTNGGHYDLRHIFRTLVAGGVGLDVYPGRPAPEYEELAAATPGMRCHETLPPGKLLEVLPTYDFGWAGFNATLNAAHLDTALPNKAFEYVGCGLPVLTLGHRALARWVAEEGVGVGLAPEDLADLDARLRSLDVPALRQRAAEARRRLTVEANAGRLLDLYDAVT
ncbi:MAG TPA: glycosyltransferase [Acidimicrobiales bacterium]|nr:glycosyltransferase [Acidimicrobiales bacterium]